MNAPSNNAGDENIIIRTSIEMISKQPPQSGSQEDAIKPDEKDKIPDAKSKLKTNKNKETLSHTKWHNSIPRSDHRNDGFCPRGKKQPSGAVCQLLEEGGRLIFRKWSTLLDRSKSSWSIITLP